MSEFGDYLDSDQGDGLTTALATDLAELGKLLYDRALVRQNDEHITDPRGNPIGWLLDTRTPMLAGDTFGKVGKVFARRMVKRNLDQVAGYGFGAYALVCSVIGASPSHSFKGGFVRGERKQHGRRRLVEGPLDRSKPVVLLDDILNSGRSALHGIQLLEGDGYEVAGVMTLFAFTWSGGRERLESRGVWVDSILDLNLRDSIDRENVTHRPE
jgi:orotate phosphoribosyltransferase